jgi:hypothetical protein
MKSREFRAMATKVLLGNGFTLEPADAELPLPALLQGRATLRTMVDEGRRVVRISDDPAVWDRFQDEAEGTDDLRTAIAAVRNRGVDIHVPRTALIYLGDWRILAREWAPGTPVSPSHPDLAKKMATFFRQLPWARVDSYIRPTPSVLDRESEWLKQRRHDVFTDAYYRDRQDGRLKAAAGKGACSATEADGLRAVLQSVAYFMSHLCHHDVRLKNIVVRRDPPPDEAGLALVDSVFARHGLAFYDPAYFIIQCTLEGHARLAADTLRAFRDRPDWLLLPMFERCGFVPFAYRIAVDLDESAGKPDRLRRAQELLPAIVAQDFDGLQRTLDAMAETGR